MKKYLIIIGLLSSLVLITYPSLAQEDIEYFSKETIMLEDGRLIDAIKINGPPEPPPGYIRPLWDPPPGGPTRSSLLLACVPAFNWCFGCSATSAAMLAGYYDIIGRNNMYAGPSNGSVMWLDNSLWTDVWINGQLRHRCPLSATMNGLDGRGTRGHVDDYWILYGATGPDPWVTNQWIEHTHGECTADYMWTNQWVWTGGNPPAPDHNTDGSTMFWNFNNGAKTHWYDLSGHPYDYDGGAGLRDFLISRGYTVTDEYNQYIVEEGLTFGFSFTDYKNQIDAGNPVLIHVEGHTMLGFGYNTSGNIVHLHDTWDYSDHTMTWAGSYSGMAHYAVTVIELTPATYTNLTIKNTEVRNGKTIVFEATNNIYGATSSTSDDLLIDGNGTIGGICTMTAGANIYLRHGFRTNAGAEFVAQIGTPDPPGTQRPIARKRAR